MKGAKTKRSLSTTQRDELLEILEARFTKNMNRHRGLEWKHVQARFDAQPEKLWSLHEMERTGGEPDVVGRDEASKGVVYFDCSAQSPAGRTSLCYDREALDARKEFKPKNSAVELAA